MHDIKSFISQKDIFARHCSIELLEVLPGTARVSMTVEQEHLNGLEMAHGGALFTLADLAFAAAANSREETAVGVNASINYIRPAVKGDVLTASAREIYSNRKLAGYQIEIHNQDNELVAVLQSTAYKLTKS
ncbi:PaaI family thioesterase [Desulfonatronovibrio magnus]|uniref:PaaI family thioesterase n=1 Tax=Desulfonatronovibrio magnus TaxID=698827 RepID=UPI0005EB6A4D|nr:hotdog fold thioesterase [Desulfonatronovibrio magnus]